jgi:hypothetical protein
VTTIPLRSGQYWPFSKQKWSSHFGQTLTTTALQAFSAKTATTTVIKTPVPTTMTATTKAILLKLDNCLLHPTKKVANYATPRCLLLLPVSNRIAITTTNANLLLPFNQDNSAIMTATHASLLLPFNQDNSATMTATHANLLLPFNQDNSAIMTATHASLLLPFNQDNSAIMTATHTSLLLPFNQDNPAIRTSVNTRNLLPFFGRNDPAITIASSLQLIVDSLFLLRDEDNSETMAPSLCRRPSRYVPYKGTFVPYDGTFGASNQGQTLDV